MYRNLYDTDCITWSPQGRIFQVEYAMQAVTQGTCCVGLRSNDAVVLCSLKRTSSKLASFQQKLFKIDDHIGAAMSGITGDAKVMSEIMRTECLHHKFSFDAEKSISRLALMVANKCQMNTQRSGKRPFGVGLLIGGFDSSGPHLFETCPSGNYYESLAVAFGARCQSSKTYLERNFESFAAASVEELMMHGLKALKASLSADIEISAESVAMGVVGKGKPWKEISEDELRPLIDVIVGNAESGDVVMESA